jgi:hypothetical protein
VAQPHGTNLESRFFDALDDLSGEPGLHGVRLDYRERKLHILSIISHGERQSQQQDGMTEPHKTHTDVAQEDAGKGAVEGDRPDQARQQGNPHGTALNDEGLPDDQTAICEDAIGANVDQSQG